MPKGRAIVIGLNGVDPKHYSGWAGPLNACEADASSMAQIAGAQGIDVHSLLTQQATRDGVMKEFAAAANDLKDGDLLMLTYSGHGGQVPDLNGDEDDGLDETWCLYDGQLVDDELYKALSSFKPGVRVVVLSDSCHSGTVVKVALMKDFLSRQPTPSTVLYRNMPNEVAHRTYLDNKKFYDKILTNPSLRESKKNIRASVFLISGCQDNQLSADGAFNGLFTGKLLHVWNGGVFKGSYLDLFKRTRKQMPPDQTPNLFWASQVNQTFLESHPFTV